MPGAYLDLGRSPEATPVPGVLVVRPNAPLFYADAQLVRDAIEAQVAAASPPIRGVVLDLSAIDELDITTAEQLEKLSASLTRSGAAVAVVHVHQPVLAAAEAADLPADVGPDERFGTTSAAVRWARSRPEHDRATRHT